MLTKLRLVDFKCFKDETFPLAPLTLLTGTNSVGKSSILQSLLLLRLACAEFASENEPIPLNGPFGLALGKFEDVLRFESRGTGTGAINIQVEDDDGDVCRLTLQSKNPTRRFARARLEQENMPTALWDDSRGAFTYLSSDRLGPKNNSVVQSAPKDRLNLGHKGEYVGDILNQCERDKVLDELQHPNASGQRFAKQVEAWLATFVPGVEIRVQRSLGSDLVSLEFRKGKISSEWERPSNIGYGVSYCLPIIVACLIAEEDSIVLIESPEAHLHPSAQSAMGTFLARVAAAGIQVFVETHSDHVLNGIRKAVLDEAHPLGREGVVIHHLYIDDGTTYKEEIRITEDGNLSSRPRSFFDQAERDIAAIVKSRFPSKK